MRARRPARPAACPDRREVTAVELDDVGSPSRPAGRGRLAKAALFRPDTAGTYADEPNGDDRRRPGCRTRPASFVRALVRDRVKFRVGRIVYLAFSRDERTLGSRSRRRSATGLSRRTRRSSCYPRRRISVTTGFASASTPSTATRWRSSCSTHGGWWCRDASPTTTRRTPASWRNTVLSRVEDPGPCARGPHPSGAPLASGSRSGPRQRSSGSTTSGPTTTSPGQSA
jgi:hypothetical protein